jgi:hypothetical protein
LLDRIHQFVRCIEGLVAPEQGKTKSQIKGRTELFIGPSHHDLIGGLFDIRSDVEHMHDYKHLSEYSREDRIEIATKEAVAEWVCRSCLERIILNPELVTAFGSMSALTEFWGGSQRERVIKWGQPFDPLAPIKDFNTDWVSDAELGARE